MAEIIRRMRAEDVPQIHDIEKQCFAMPWSERSIMHDLTENIVARWLVLADENEMILAYAALWLVVDEGHVCNIAVRPDVRGRGYGRRVTAALIDCAREEGMRLMTLEVRRSNGIAQALYHSLGFQDVGYRKRYYEDNREDALIMYLDLVPAEPGCAPYGLNDGVKQ